MKFNHLVIYGAIFVSTLAGAQAPDNIPADKPASAVAPKPPEPSPRMRFRSNENAHIWVGANLGLDISPELSGLATSWGIGAQLDLTLRIRVARCGAMFIYRNQSLYYADPADVHNMLGGAGAFCNIVNIGYSRPGLRGAHIEAHALIEYGRSDYTIKGSSAYNEHSHHNDAMGGTVGGDFFFPLWFGFWANAGLSWETNTFRYEYLDRSNNLHKSDQSTFLMMGRFGLVYSFL